jgi:hypothetical protein
MGTHRTQSGPHLLIEAAWCKSLHLDADNWDIEHDHPAHLPQKLLLVIA